VLYTAQKYVNRRIGAQQKEAAQQRLAPLIRCQHLSLYWLSAALHSQDAPKLLLHGLAEQLKLMLVLRHSGVGSRLTAARLQRRIPGAPASWSLGKRASKQVSSVQVVWELEVSKVKETALRSSSE
jgi:hypothetical protein